MRYLFFIITFICIVAAPAQTGTKDSILYPFLKKISPQWNYNLTKNSLTIIMKDSMWIDFYNSAGVPQNDPWASRYAEDTVKMRFKPQHPELKFKMEPRLTKQKINKTRLHNKVLVTKIDSLKFKYKISHLKFSMRYTQEIIRGANKEEEKRVEKYREEKTLLESKFIEIPIYNTERYSLFKEHCSWEIKNAWHMRPVMFPQESAKQANELDELLYDYLRRSFNEK